MSKLATHVLCICHRCGEAVKWVSKKPWPHWEHTDPAKSCGMPPIPVKPKAKS